MTMCLRTRIGSGLLHVAGAVIVTTLGSSAARALDEGYCDGYANKAIEQTNEYHFRKCKKPGNSQWWSTDHAYHFNWCKLLPAGSTLAQKGDADRANVLSTCRDEANGRGPAAQHPAALTCPETLGTLQFGGGDVEAIFGPPQPPSDGAGMTCNYRYGNGLITLYAKWAVPANFLGWQVSAPVQMGCVEKTGAEESYATSIGLGMRSAKFFADAGIVGSTNETINLAKEHGFGPLQNFIIGAELQARSCMLRGNY